MWGIGCEAQWLVEKLNAEHALRNKREKTRLKLNPPTNAADYVIIMRGLGVIGPEKFPQYFTGHPAAEQAYAWSSPMEKSNKRRFFAVFASATNYVAGRSRKGGERMMETGHESEDFRS